ncbi:MAG: PKD domain-containing protein [Candidatus Hydrogenedentes bacterium]|nr:PKD domain-containing protein [Candidatus Hydrogenedentota bacterium]
MHLDDITVYPADTIAVRGSVTTGTIIFPVGAASAAIPLKIKDDNLYEQDETAIFELVDPVEASLGTETLHTLTIEDDDPMPVVQLTATANINLPENGSTLWVAVVSSVPTGQPIVIPYEITGSAEEDVDFTLASEGTVTIPPGGRSQDIVITPLDDTDLEGVETVVITLQPIAAFGVLGSKIQRTVRIIDNEVPSVQFTEVESEVEEGDGTASLEVELSDEMDQEVTVLYSVTGGSATSSADYVLADGTLTFAAHDISESITVSITDDSTGEDPETVVVTLRTPTNATLGTNVAHTLTITDDDGAVEGGIELADVNLEKDEGDGEFLVEVTLADEASIATTVEYYVTGGNATEGVLNDYTLGSGSVTWEISESGIKTFPITLNDDAINELDETIEIALRVPAGYHESVGANDSLIVTIQDNDDPPVVSFVESVSSAPETTETRRVLARLSGQSEQLVQVQVAATDITASLGPDYYANEIAFPLLLSWEPGDSNDKTVEFGVVDDALAEADETLELELQPVTGGVATVDPVHGVHTATIVDNEATSEVSFGFPMSSFNEGDGPDTLTLTVAQSPASTETVVVAYGLDTEGTTATEGSGEDFQVSGSALTFNPGETTKQFDVTIYNSDDLDEGDEYIKLVLSAVSGPVELGSTHTHMITIVDDDVAPTPAFSQSGTGGLTPFAVTFADLSTLGTSPSLTYNWDFGNGNTYTGTVPPSQSYTTAGSYDVRLEVVGTSGTRSLTKHGAVTAHASASLPVAGFTASALTAYTGADIRFTDRSTPGSATITAYDWDFDDGSTGTGSSTTHAYAAAGSYDVNLEVTNADSGTDTTDPGDTVTITVIDGPEATLSTDIASIDLDTPAGNTATLTWSASNAASVYLSPGFGDLSAGGTVFSGTIEVEPLASTTYRLTVNGPEGIGPDSIAMVSIEVTGTPEPQPEGSFGEKYGDEIYPEDATLPYYDPDRFSLITGFVKGASGSGIENVEVRASGEMQYGTALTDGTGRFTLPIEGGGVFTLDYTKAGFVPSSRQVHVLPNDVAVAEEVCLLQPDARHTAVDFSELGANEVIVHESSLASTDRGARRVRTVFTGGNRVYSTDEYGNKLQELGEIVVRATDYVTPASMPAALPPTSAFTYCAELSVDGQSSVAFEKPLVNWVENFYGFPVGQIVPVGYYDRVKGEWVPSGNGAVVRVVDIDNDDVADGVTLDPDATTTSTVLANFDGDSDFLDELDGIRNAALESEFMRFETAHFSPWDANWPKAPPVVTPGIAAPPRADEGEPEDPADQPNNSAGCYVNYISGDLHEDAAIPGTGLTLHYQSKRAAQYEIVVPLSNTVEAKRVAAKISIAGEEFSGTYSGNVNGLTPRFLWDGRDYLGNKMDGTVKAHIVLEYTYDSFYAFPDGAAPQAFGQLGITQTGMPLRDFVLRREIDVPISIRALPERYGIAEGWTLSNNHFYSQQAVANYIQKGDGTTISASELNWVPSAIPSAVNGLYIRDSILEGGDIVFDRAGNLFTQYKPGYYNDGLFDNVLLRRSPNGAVESLVELFGGEMRDIAVDPKGNIFLSMEIVDLDTFDGFYGLYYYNVESGVLTWLEELLYSPVSIAADRWGNVYCLYDSSVTKYSPKGEISDFVVDVPGEGIAVAGNGDIYVTDPWNQKIYRFDAAGNRTETATDYPPRDIAVDSTGNVYFTTGPDRAEKIVGTRLYKIDHAGVIQHIGGNGQEATPAEMAAGDGFPALDRPIAIDGIGIDGSDNLYYSNIESRRIFRVGGPAPEEEEGVRAPTVDGAGNRLFYEADGTGYAFDATGLHQYTFDADTGVHLTTFNYAAGTTDIESVVDQFGNEVTFDYTPGSGATEIVITAPDGIATTVTLDEHDQLTEVNYPNGATYAFEYANNDGRLTLGIDPLGAVYNYSYEGNGKVKRIVTPAINPARGLGIWNYDHEVDEDGVVTATAITPSGDVSEYVSDPVTRVETLTGPSGFSTTTFTSYDKSLEEIANSTGLNLSTTMSRDPRYSFDVPVNLVQDTGRSASSPIEVDLDVDYGVDELSGALETVTGTTTVNDAFTGTVVKDLVNATVTSTTPEGREFVSHYDPATLLATHYEGIKDASNATVLYDTKYFYDSRGRLTEAYTGNPADEFDPINRWAHLSYYPDGTGTAVGTRGQVQTVTNARGESVAYEYNVMGQVTKATYPNMEFTTQDYYVDGALKEIRNAKGGVFGFEYNALGLISKYALPSGRAYLSKYDNDKRLVQLTFPSGKVYTNQYNNGHIEAISGPDWSTTVSYSADGRLEHLEHGAEGIEFTYDGASQDSIILSGTLNQTLSVDFNDLNLKSSVAYAGGASAYAYDDDALLTSVTNGGRTWSIDRNDPATPGVSNATGRVESITDGTLTLSPAYTPFGETESFTYAVDTTSYAWDLSLDIGGRIESKAESLGLTAADYGYVYDEVGQLEQVVDHLDSNAVVESYGYDANGNRISSTVDYGAAVTRTYAYNADDQLTSINGDEVEYAYDLDGFLTERRRDVGGGTVETTGYAYNTRGELLSVELPAGEAVERVDYVYDPLGRCIARRAYDDEETLLSTEKYLWNGMTELLAVFDGSNQMQLRFEYLGGGLPVGVDVWDGSGYDYYYLAYDQLGSLRYALDATGAVVKEITYDAFGNILSDSNPTLKLQIGFAGGQADPDTGLVRFVARDYDPEIGRWTAGDPIGVVGGLNAYLYVGNNPVNLTDPFGLMPSLLEEIRFGLGVAGMIPVIGIFADGTSLLISVALLDATGALVDVVSMVEGVGQGARAAQLTVKGAKAAAKYADEAGDVAKAVGKKRGPKTDPNAPHNKKIREEGQRLRNEGNDIVAGGGVEKERLVETRGGEKPGRRPDIIYSTPEGELRGVNVGRTNADGTPVSREVGALNDLNGPGQLPTVFLPYDR